MLEGISRAVAATDPDGVPSLSPTVGAEDALSRP